MSLAQKPEQMYYVPPRARLRQTSATVSSSANAVENPLKAQAVKCKSNPPEMFSTIDSSSTAIKFSKQLQDDVVFNNVPTESEEVSSIEPFSSKLDDGTMNFSLADRLASLEMNSTPTLQSRNPAKRRSLRENTIFLKEKPKPNKETASAEAKTKPSLGVYVPPHRRNQSLTSDLTNVKNHESGDGNVFFDDSFEVDEFQNFRSRKSDSYLYKLYSTDFVNDDQTFEDLSHVLELNNFDSSFKEDDILEHVNLSSSMVDIRWINDSSALLACRTQSTADLTFERMNQERNTENHDPNESAIVCSKLQNATIAGRKKAFAICDELKQKLSTEKRPRPETTDFFARQFIGRHLGRSDIIPKKEHAATANGTETP